MEPRRVWLCCGGDPDHTRACPSVKSAEKDAQRASWDWLGALAHTDEHVCAYTLPVAWAYDYGWLSVDDQNERFVRIGQRVTALRCACGKEAPR